MGIAITILIWLVWAILALLGVFLVLLHLPYRFQLGARWGENHVDARAWVGLPLRILGLMLVVSFEQQRGAFVLFGMRVKTFSLVHLYKNRTKKEKKKKKPRKKKSPGRLRGTVDFMQMPGKTHLLGVIRRALCLEANLKGRFGFDDPATTGSLAMTLALIQIVFPGFGQQVELDYIGPVCEGDLELSALIWLPRIYVLAIVFLLSREGRALLSHRRKPSLA